MAKVLLIDDEVDICLLLTGVLQKLGFQTTYALTLREAKEKLLIDSFETVFIDLNLPDGVGYQLIPEIRRINMKVKVIVVSAYDSEREKANQKGADYFIAKPFSRKKIVDALEQLNVCR